MINEPVDTVLNARHKTHGNFNIQARTAQNLKDVMHSTPNWKEMPSYMREAIELICTKLSRIGHGDYLHRDHSLDGSGYFNLIYKGLEDNFNLTSRAQEKRGVD